MRPASCLLRDLLPPRTVSWGRILGQGSESSRREETDTLKRYFVQPVPVGRGKVAEDREDSGRKDEEYQGGILDRA